MSYVKHLVSKKKRRFIEGGFDLDLAYIKPNIVAMGYPSENLEGVYRNNFDDVVRFLDIKHKDKYKVYNLCSERTYDPAKFSNRVSVFPFDDHNAPPFELMLPCCKDIDQWLLSDNENVAIIHCKAGKGRTGVMICAYLLYKKYFDSADDAMQYYADARTNNRKGVTIPSQRRYIQYFGYYMRNNQIYEPKTLLLRSITFVGIPMFNSSGTCSPSFVVYQTKVILYKSKNYEVKKSDETFTMTLERPLPICGDIKIDFFHKGVYKKERMFVFWVNTFFLENGDNLTRSDGGCTTLIDTASDGNGELRRFELYKAELDKANKDKKHKVFAPTFKIYLNITVPMEKTTCDPVLPTSDPVLPLSVRRNAETLNTLLHKEQSDINKTLLKKLALQEELKNKNLLSPTSVVDGKQLPRTGGLQSFNSAPFSPTGPPPEPLDKALSRSMEVLSVEEEQLSDDGDDEEEDLLWTGQSQVTQV